MTYINLSSISERIVAPHARLGALWNILIYSVLVFPSVALAGTEFDIVNSANGTKLGSMTFPIESGSSSEGVQLELDGFTEGDITSIHWELNPVLSLDLYAVRGDNPCSDPSQHGPCTNQSLTLAPTFSKKRAFSCPPPPPPGTKTQCVAVESISVIEFQPMAPAHVCVGFEPPLNQGPVTINMNRVLPFKADLFDGEGLVLTDELLSPPPVIQVHYDSGIEAAPIDVTADALTLGNGMEGNQFVFSGSQWKFNLKVKNYTGAGTYTVTMASGNDAMYRVAPTCTAQFILKG